MATPDPLTAAIGAIAALAGAVVKLALRRRSNLSRWIRKDDDRWNAWVAEDRKWKAEQRALIDDLKKELWKRTMPLSKN